MNQFVNWGNETPEQLERRLKYEEEMRELAINKLIMEAQSGRASSAMAIAAAAGGSNNTTTTTTVPPTTTTTTATPTTTTTTHVAGVDFTIEWFMKVTSWTTPTGFPRPYSLGSFPAPNAVSVESSGGHIYWWTGGGSAKIDYNGTGFQTNIWYHIAVTRNNGSLGLYIDGQRKATASFNNAISAGSNNLYIGAEPTSAINSTPKNFVNGKMTNFRWTANCLYTGSSFTVPTSPLTATSDTKFLMLATDSGSLTTDSSTYARTVTNVGSASWSSDSPFVSGGGSVNFAGTSCFTVPASTDWSL